MNDVQEKALAGFAFAVKQLFPRKALESPLVVADESVIGGDEDVLSVLYQSNARLTNRLVTVFCPYVQQESLSRMFVKHGKRAKLPHDLKKAIDASTFVVTLLNDLDDCTPFRVRLIRAALAQGLAVCHMPGIQLRHVATFVAGIDYELLQRKAAYLYSSLKNGGKVEVYTKGSSQGKQNKKRLAFELKEKTCAVCDGRFPPGHIGNLPSGECYVEPADRSARGELVLDGSFLDMVIARGEQVILEFDDGRLVDISPPASENSISDALEKRLGRGNSKCWRLAEFAIGLNPSVKKLTGSELVDEKATETGHIALGQPVFMEQEIGKPHCDLIFRRPTVTLNGKLLVDDGKVIFHD